MMPPRAVFFFFLFFLSLLTAGAQDPVLDSLKKLLEKEQRDTARLLLLIGIAEICAEEDIPEYALPAAKIATSLLDAPDPRVRKMAKRCLADANGNMGYYANVIEGDAQKALNYYRENIKLYQEIGDTIGEAMLLNNIGLIYKRQGDIPEAMAYYDRSLKLLEKVGDKKGIGLLLTNLGVVYEKYDDPAKALEFYERSLKIREELNDLEGMAMTYNSMGLLYLRQEKYDRSLELQRKAFELRKRTGNKLWLSKSLSEIGFLHYHLGAYDSALAYYHKSLALREELKDKQGTSETLTDIGQVYLVQGKTNLAEELGLRAFTLAKSTNFPEHIMVSARLLREVYRKKKDPARELAYFETYVSMRDTVMNQENREASYRQQIKYEFDKKEMEVLAEQEKRDALAEAEKWKRDIIIFSVTLLLITVLVFSLVLFSRFRVIRAQKSLIEVQKAEVESQKTLIEDKNKDITDSINYAKRIQEALLPAKDIKYRLFPEAFVLFSPRDIVSGDFYWFGERSGKRIIAAVDCTGHGVPGAFMSMIGNAFLNEIVHEKGVTAPARILDLLRESIVKSLKQSGAEGESKDGMDVALLVFDDAKGTVEFAGANNPLWWCRMKEGSCVMEEIKGDKQPAGFQGRDPFPFTNHVIRPVKGDTLYIFTDGYADQFGGPHGKKLKYRQLMERLLAIQEKNMAEQESVLLKYFHEWRGELDQVDDVLVIGIRV